MNTKATKNSSTVGFNKNNRPETNPKATNKLGSFGGRSTVVPNEKKLAAEQQKIEKKRNLKSAKNPKFQTSVNSRLSNFFDLLCGTNQKQNHKLQNLLNKFLTRIDRLFSKFSDQAEVFLLALGDHLTDLANEISRLFRKEPKDHLKKGIQELKKGIVQAFNEAKEELKAEFK